MKSQISHSAQSQNCPNCSERSVALLQLSCSHSFCIKCLTFSYHKFSSSMQRPNLTRCIICERVCELSEEDIQGVGDFTDKVLVPLVKEENEKHSVKSKNDNQYQLSNNEMSAASKQLKSYELSTEKVTPAPKGFYSRCESPKSAFTQIYCQVHPEQQLSIICFSCGNTLLCISCIANKKHSSHNIKTMAKGIDTIYEQMQLSRLKGKEYQDRLQISRRRLEDRRQIIQERWDKTVNTVRLHFNNLLELVNRKCDEVIEEYSSFFSKGLEDAVQDRLKVDQALQHVRRQLERLKDIPKIQTNPIQVIKRSTQLMDELNDLRQPELQNGDISQCDSDRVVRQVVHLSQKIEKIYPYLRKQALKTHGIQNYRSQQKLLKENYLKRVKTNVMSLNSSRDKKQKKCTKTEEDEKRYKSKANYKTESNSKVMKVNKALPTYLLQHLDKQTKDAPLPQCLMDLNPLQSSFKSTSKILSKSHIPSAAEQHRRKKEHVAYIKDCLERKQRKTFNGTSKQVRGTAEGMRKKKIPF